VDLLETVKATYLVVGQEIPDIALLEIVAELERYDQKYVLEALTRCRRELRRITLADILDRLPGGHPGPEEAWAIVSQTLTNEYLSIAWTSEMAEAFGVARALGDDQVAARMAFKETYTRLISTARAKNTPVQWRVSLGYDPAGRELAYQEVAKRNGQALPALTGPESKTLSAMPEEVKKIIWNIGNIGHGMPGNS
jgi:hypothetical protein